METPKLKSNLSKRKKTCLFLGIAVILPIFLSFILAEFYIRFFSPAGYITPATLHSQSQSLETGPALFAKKIYPQKKQSVLWKGSPVSINSMGYRGPEFTLKKPVGTTRIIIYGGSVVLDGLHDWPRQVENLLRLRGFPNVEVINAGVIAQSSFDCFGLFFAEGHLFDPDYVILYSGWNDLKFFANKAPLLRQYQPYQQDPLYHYQGRLDQWLCEFSQLYVRLRYRYILWRFRAGPEGAKPSSHSSKVSETALRQYRLTLETFIDMVKNAKAIPILMPEAHLLDAENTAEELSLINYDIQTLTPEALWPATQQLESIMRGVALEKKANFIDTSVLCGNRLYLMDNSHSTAEGSKKLAEITADTLESLLRSHQSGDTPH